MYLINEDKCMGCGVCARICPEGIEIEDEKAKIKNQDVACLDEAAKVCPVKIITNNKE